MSNDSSPLLVLPKRYAVYCRVSSDERLDQSFNSIDAQKEAGHAFIKSQSHEGWIAVADDYDDGGFSGGNMERPALRRLMADIQMGKIDIVVVYKIDRLSRSLADFARMVDVFDRHRVSFSAVTQQINSATSMGRLMLNVLLSFAQFEREVTGERIRDKIAASKAKGMWMGGPLPLGYDVRDRMLVVNETEAILVRRIFADFVTVRGMKPKVQPLGAAIVLERRDGGQFKLSTFIPLKIRKRGASKVVVRPDVQIEAPGKVATQYDQPLLVALTRAFYWQQLLDDGVVGSGSEIAQREGLHHSTVNELLRLTLLEPAIILSILSGQQPKCISLLWFQRNPLPTDWVAQREVVAGFDA